jgi:hypothetical protein
MQQMLAKIDGTNDIVSRSEVKAIELLEKQTKLQEESIANEREFLSVFKSLANSMKPTQ